MIDFTVNRRAAPQGARAGREGIAMKTLIAGLVGSLVLVQPALAQSGGWSAPSDLTLLALGLFGVALGHRVARPRRS